MGSEKSRFEIIVGLGCYSNCFGAFTSFSPLAVCLSFKLVQNTSLLRLSLWTLECLGKKAQGCPDTLPVKQ